MLGMAGCPGVVVRYGLSRLFSRRKAGDKIGIVECEAGGVMLCASRLELEVTGDVVQHPRPYNIWKPTLNQRNFPRRKLQLHFEFAQCILS
jgi:hypothetical protein